jgi:hypothetical protein
MLANSAKLPLGNLNLIDFWKISDLRVENRLA